VRWEAQRHTAFPSRALTDHLALNALEMTAVESAVVASLAGAVQNAACYPQ